ncbi:MAG: hypothetical protein U0531_09295 [Dehalococcoidia bacterium]
MIVARDQRLLTRATNGDEQALLRTAANTFPTFPAWSPDGKSIAYAQSTIFTGQGGADWGGDIFIVDAGGGNPRLLWKHDQPGAQVQGLAWTPDGAALLFGYQLTKIKDGRYEGQVHRIDRIAVADGKVSTVVDGALLPSLSKDGSKLAYLTQTEDGKGGLWVGGPDGSGATQVIELGQRFLAIMFPRLSPDGGALAFSAVVTQARAPEPRQDRGLLAALRGLLASSADAHGFPMDVWRVTVADGAVTKLTSFGEDEPYPVWGPDGRRLTIIATGGIYEVNADGSDMKKVGQGSFGGQVDVR